MQPPPAGPGGPRGPQYHRHTTLGLLKRANHPMASWFEDWYLHWVHETLTYNWAVIQGGTSDPQTTPRRTSTRSGRSSSSTPRPSPTGTSWHNSRRMAGHRPTRSSGNSSPGTPWSRTTGTSAPCCRTSSGPQGGSMTGPRGNTMTSTPGTGPSTGSRARALHNMALAELLSRGSRPSRSDLEGNLWHLPHAGPGSSSEFIESLEVLKAQGGALEHWKVIGPLEALAPPF